MSSVDPASSPALPQPRPHSSPSPALTVALTGAVLVVGLALALLPPLVALWLVFGAALFALVLVRPIVGLYLLPFAVSCGSLASLQVHGVFVGPTDLIVGALAAAWLFRALSPSRAESWSSRLRGAGNSMRAWCRREPVSVWVFAGLLAYLAVVILSLAVASDRISTVKEVLKWSEVATVAAVGVWLLGDLARVRILAWMTIGAGLLEALLGLVQWVFAPGADRIAVGTFDQPNPFAGFLTFAVVVALALALFAPTLPERWAAGGAAVILTGAQSLALSRGATLGLAAALVVLAIVGWGWERLAVWTVGIALPLLGLAWLAHAIPSSFQQRLLDQLNMSDAAVCGHVTQASDSNLERLAHWAAGLRMFLAHPLLGVGAGNYNAAYARYAAACWLDPLGHAHNYYITAAAETGLLGLAAFVALTGGTFALGWWASRIRNARPRARGGGEHPTPQAIASGDDRLARALALGFLAAVVALAVHNLFDDLFVHAMEMQFALCLAALVRLGPLRQGVLSRGEG